MEVQNLYYNISETAFVVYKKSKRYILISLRLGAVRRFYTRFFDSTPYNSGGKFYEKEKNYPCNSYVNSDVGAYADYGFMQ